MGGDLSARSLMKAFESLTVRDLLAVGSNDGTPDRLHFRCGSPPPGVRRVLGK